MAKQSAHAENLFVVRWGAPEAADVDEIKGAVPVIHEACGKELIYIAVMPGDLPNLDDGQRKLLMELTEAILPHCSAVLIVMEARGFRGALLRSAMTAVTLLTRKHNTLRVVDSIEAAVEIVAEKLPGGRDLVERTLRKVGAEFGRVTSGEGPPRAPAR
jgi:hypothetical protein